MIPKTLFLLLGFFSCSYNAIGKIDTCYGDSVVEIDKIYYTDSSMVEKCSCHYLDHEQYPLRYTEGILLNGIFHGPIVHYHLGEVTSVNLVDSLVNFSAGFHNSQLSDFSVGTVKERSAEPPNFDRIFGSPGNEHIKAYINKKGEFTHISIFDTRHAGNYDVVFDPALEKMKIISTRDR